MPPVAEGEVILDIARWSVVSDLPTRNEQEGCKARGRKVRSEGCREVHTVLFAG